MNIEGRTIKCPRCGKELHAFLQLNVRLTKPPPTRYQMMAVCDYDLTTITWPSDVLEEEVPDEERDNA